MVALNENVMNIIYTYKHNLEYMHVMEEYKDILKKKEWVNERYKDENCNWYCLQGLCSYDYIYGNITDNMCPRCGYEYDPKDLEKMIDIVLELVN